MNKRIISVVMAATMFTSAVPAMATTEGILKDDILLISAGPTVNKYEGKVAGVTENQVIVTIDGTDYAFIYEKAADFKVGDAVVVSSEASLQTKDIKEATLIELADTKADEETVVFSYNQFNGKISGIEKGIVNVTIDGIDYGFIYNEKAVFSSTGDEAELKAGDEVTVVSAASLKTKDIKTAEAIVVKSEDAEMSVFADTFKLDGEQLLSADGNLVVNVENPGEYDGKKLLVFYNMATKSIPAQTSPEKIIVLDNETEEAPVAPVKAVSYNRYEGVVKAVDNKYVSVEIEGAEYNFGYTSATPLYTIDGEAIKEIKVGDNIIVASTSLLKTKDMKSAAAIVKYNPEDRKSSIYVDTFKLDGEQLMSADGELVLNMENAKAYDGKLLLVFYDMATLSIPAQTNPVKVVELPERVEVSFKVGDSTLSINGENVKVETPYVVGSGVTLVPVRVISEAFGAEVIWNDNDKSIEIKMGDTSIMIKINSNLAVIEGDMVEELESAPELTANGNTMVPLRFISERLGAVVNYDEATQGIKVEMN